MSRWMRSIQLASLLVLCMALPHMPLLADEWSEYQEQHCCACRVQYKTGCDPSGFSSGTNDCGEREIAFTIWLINNCAQGTWQNVSCDGDCGGGCSEAECWYSEECCNYPSMSCWNGYCEGPFGPQP
jgi:hypothetical protein